jgi:hypothetical protein
MVGISCGWIPSDCASGWIGMCNELWICIAKGFLHQVRSEHTCSTKSRIWIIVGVDLIEALRFKDRTLYPAYTSKETRSYETLDKGRRYISAQSRYIFKRGRSKVENVFAIIYHRFLNACL